MSRVRCWLIDILAWLDVWIVQHRIYWLCKTVGLSDCPGEHRRTLAMLLWLDRQVFRHKWSWLCNLAWDAQLEAGQLPTTEDFPNDLDKEDK